MPASWPIRPDRRSFVYPILDLDLATARGFEPLRLLTMFCTAGAPIVQLRAKRLAAAPFLALADAARAVAERHGGLLVINDRVDVARIARAHGVHVGQEDVSPAQARVQVGEQVLVGVSTHTDAQVRAARPTPANYIAIGPVFSTTSKDRPDPVVGLEGVRRARALLGADVPLVAIGGITLDTVQDVVDAGASAVAVISDLLVGDPGARLAEYHRRLDTR